MIIFFHGSDGWRSREKVRALTEGYLAKNPGGTGLFQFDFEDTTDAVAMMRQLEETLSGGGLFATKKFVVVRNVFGKEKKETSGKESSGTVGKKKLGSGSRVKPGMTIGTETATRTKELGRAGDFLGVLERHADIAEKDSPVILLVWELRTPKKTDALMKYLEINAGLQQAFALLDDRHLEQWAVAYLKQHAPETTITREALQRLLRETSADLFRLEAELVKLANFVGAGVIESKTVTQLVQEDHVENRVFDAFNALAVGDTRTALAILEPAMTSADETLKLLGLCAWQLRMIAAISDAYYTRGARADSAVAQVTGYKPFQIGKILRSIGKYTPEAMVRRFTLLAELDAQAKGQDGGLDPRLALTLFVTKF
jgi:DNA polymerase III delta subunit